MQNNIEKINRQNQQTIKTQIINNANRCAIIALSIFNDAKIAQKISHLVQLLTVNRISNFSNILDIEEAKHNHEDQGRGSEIFPKENKEMQW